MNTSTPSPAQQVFDYLIDWEQQTRKPLFSISEHRDMVIEENELQGLPGVEMDVADDYADTWLRIERLRPEPPPQPPELISEFLTVKNAPDEKPTQHTEIEAKLTALPEALVDAASESEALPEPDVDGLVRLQTSQIPGLESEIARWIDTQWTGWATREKPRRTTMKRYEDLFRLQKRIEEEGSESQTEVVWGLGRCLWNHEQARVDYPLITRRVEIELDEHLDIVVRPTGQDPVIETERLERLGVSGASTVRKLARSLIDEGSEEMTPFNHEAFGEIALAAANHLHEQGEYYPHVRSDTNDRRNPSAKAYPRVNDTTVIFARTRSTHIFADDVRRLREALQDSGDTPSILQAVVKGPPPEPHQFERIPFRGLSGTGTGAGSFGFEGDSRAQEPKELYFPRPYNAEQVQIVERLEQFDGVVVQGPPGTGKSHTIANIICHYLATGRRVLVTSKGESALEVLRDHLPEPLRPLAISLLTSEREGLRQLEFSVSEIASELTTLNEQDLEREIRETERRVETYHREIEGLDTQLRQIAEVQLEPVELFGQRMAPEALARWVIGQEDNHGWFSDRPVGPVGTVPFSESDIEILRNARQRAGHDLVHLTTPTPTPADLPSEESIIQLHRLLRSREELAEDVRSSGLLEFDLRMLPRAKELQGTLGEFRSLADEVTEAWQLRLRQEFAKHDSPAQYLGAIEEWMDQARALAERRNALIGVAVDMDDAVLTEPKFHQALEQGAAGKRPVGLLTPKPIKEAVTGILIDGETPRSRAQWQTVRDAATLRRDALKLLTRWNAIADEFHGPSVTDISGYAAPRQVSDLLKQCDNARKLAREFDSKLPGQIGELFGQGYEHLYKRPDDLNLLERSLDVAIRRRDLDDAFRQARALQEQLCEYGDPISARAKELLQGLGSEGLTRDDLETQWREIRSDLHRVDGLEEDFERMQRIIKKIRDAGAETWAHDLETLPVTEEDHPRLLPSDVSTAWIWAQATAHIEAIDERDRLQSLTNSRGHAEQYLSQAHQRAVELRTWLAIKRNTTSNVSSALQAYLKAIKSIGKGTGKRAVRYRREAQTALKTAHHAVPCWIMPHHRVSESLPPEFGSFDLVIVDEASQSDAWALPSLLRGKQILVVGDDKQVSPAAVGVEEATVRRMQNTHLQEAAYGSFLLPDRSIYDLATTLFAQNAIRLREHFRCVEPIIAFSSNEFYNGEIKPLRIPKPSERLDPPLIDVFVEGGKRDAKRQINEAEAQAIVDETAAIVEDTRYNGRSIGVITLLGHQQANLLRERIYQRIGSEAWEAHRLHVGDPSTFQGREADIVMLSMVVSPGQVQAATRQSDEQRFNVAASRARDRLYVFHSVPRSDLKAYDLRARLLDHLSQPFDQAPSADTAELRTHCQSEFEIAVFDALVERGYQVIPQVRAGAYSIDLVVEGDNDERLAIELDGDQYHVDRWIEDMQRQRILERMGWRFWRCWGSSFTLDPDGCLADLEGKLEELGITPTTKQTQKSNRYTEYRHVRALEAGSVKLSPENAETTELPTESPGSELESASESPAQMPRSEQILQQERSQVSTASAKRDDELNEPALKAPLGSQVDILGDDDPGRDHKPSGTRRIDGSEQGDGHAPAKEDKPTAQESGDEVVPDPDERFVHLNDVVVYSVLNENERQARVQIVSGSSSTEHGIINRNTPIGLALVDAELGEVVTARMPTGKELKLQVMDIIRPKS